MRKHLRKSEIKELNQNIFNLYNVDGIISKSDKVEIVDDIVFVNNIPYFFQHDGNYVPTLFLLDKNPFLKKITVDMGAVKFVVNGADIMKPGITKIDDGIKKDEIVVIVDERHGKALAVGKTLFSTEELRQLTSGKAIINIHWVGDEIWSMKKD